MDQRRAAVTIVRMVHYCNRQVRDDKSIRTVAQSANETVTYPFLGYALYKLRKKRRAMGFIPGHGFSRANKVGKTRECLFTTGRIL